MFNGGRNVAWLTSENTVFPEEVLLHRRDCFSNSDYFAFMLKGLSA